MTPTTASPSSIQTLDPAATDRLAAALRGTLLRPSEAGYDAARSVWNGMIDRRPALIAQCADEGDVIVALRFAQRHGLSFSVRGGGHNVAGSAVRDGGLVIDLRRMNEVHVDVARRRVSAQGGATIGEVDAATMAHGLATPLGVVTETGIAGLTLGGGMGWLRRKHGLSCDALLSADVVTADGHLLRASATEHPDLFWALRGGGGNFGVVTRFTYALYDLDPEVFLLAVFYPIDEAKEILQWMRSYMASAPDAFAPIGVLAHVPPLDELPAERHGEPCLLLVGPYAGDAAQGEQALDALRHLGTPIADLSGPMPFLDVQQFFDADYPSGGRYYWTSTHLERLSDAAIDWLIALNDAAPSAHSTVDVWFQGGALGRVEAGATAFGARSAPVLIGVEANWHTEEEDEANVAWARRCRETLQPFSDGRMYLNFPGFGEGGETDVRTTYGSTYKRLAEIKRRYDPENLFGTHQNIAPAHEPAG